MGSLIIRCGKTTDGEKALFDLCKAEGEKLAILEKVGIGESVDIEFWTSDQPSELIGFGNFTVAADGEIVTDIDTSQSTL